MSPERLEPIAVALVDPRRRLRAYADHLEARRVRVVAVVAEARVLRRLPEDCSLDAVAIGGSGRNVPAAIAGVAELGGDIPVLVCGDSPARDDLLDALRAGAESYVVAPSVPRAEVCEELALALHATAHGGTWVSPGVARHLVSEVRDSMAGRSFASLAALPNVTRRERQVLELIGVGCTYREISERLFISASTVKTHAHSALRKLGLRNRVEVVHWLSQMSAASSSSAAA